MTEQIMLPFFHVVFNRVRKIAKSYY